MAIISGVASGYTTADYLVQDYFIGAGLLSITASVTADVEQRIKNGGSIQWDECGTWETWLRNQWEPGIPTPLTLTSTTSGVCTRSGSAEADIVLTNTTTGSAIWGPTVSTSLTFTTSSLGNVIYDGSASSNIALTTYAFGGKILSAEITGDLTVTVTAQGERKPGGTAIAPLTMTTSATGVVTISGTATPSLTFTATGTGNLTFFGAATAPIVLNMDIAGGLVVPPPNPATTYVVDSETMEYVLPHDQVNDVQGTHLGHDYYKIPVKDGETRVFKVLFDTRTTEIQSETREQPTEVF